MYRFVNVFSQTIHKRTAFLTISGICVNYWHNLDRKSLINANIGWKPVSHIRSARMNGDKKQSIGNIYIVYMCRLATVVNSYSEETDGQLINSVGTGMYIRLPNDKRLYVLTNWHVVRGYKYLDIRSFVMKESLSYLPSGDRHLNTKAGSKTYWKARVVYARPHLDLALALIIDEPEPYGVKPVQFADGMAGEPVVSIGNPDIWYSLGYGDITCADRPKWTDDGQLSEWSDRDFDVVLHTSTISAGFSGGPLINMCGEVVGVNHGGGPFIDIDRQNQALTAKSVKEFLKNAINWQKYELNEKHSFDGRKCLGVSVQELDIRLILKVQKCLNSSTYAKGLKGALLVTATMFPKQPLLQDQKLYENDIIVKVGEKEVNCVNDLKREIEWSGEKAINISVVRYNSDTESQESIVLKVKPQELSANLI